jgi:hypothetical protein
MVGDLNRRTMGMAHDLYMQSDVRIPKNFDLYSDNSDEEEKMTGIKQEDDFYSTPYSQMMRQGDAGMMGMGMMSEQKDYSGMMNIKQESYMGGRRPDSQMQNR